MSYVELLLILNWLLLAAACWVSYQLLLQNGRLLHRLEAVEVRLGIGVTPSWETDPAILALVQPEQTADQRTTVDQRSPAEAGLRLNLGCGGDVRPGWLNHDRVLRPSIDVAWDLRERPWPLDDISCDQILARDVLEHLPDVVGFMDECWRLLKPGGYLVIQAVLAQTQEQWINPTHVRGFLPASFQYFDPTFEYWQRFGRWYTERAWRLEIAEIGGPNVVAVLRPRKGQPGWSDGFGAAARQETSSPDPPAVASSEA